MGNLQDGWKEMAEILASKGARIGRKKMKKPDPLNTLNASEKYYLKWC